MNARTIYLLVSVSSRYERSMELLSNLLSQMGQLHSVWMPFVVAAAIIGVVVWKVAEAHFSGRIATLEQRILLKDDVIVDLQRERAVKAESTLALPTLKGASYADELDELDFPADEPRIYLPENVTFQSLMTLRKSASGIQADKLVASYRGKWLSVSGRLTDSELTRDGACLSVAPEESPFAPHISLYFSREPDGLELINKGEMVSAVGKIAHIVDSGIVMTNCEFAA